MRRLRRLLIPALAVSGCLHQPKPAPQVEPSKVLAACTDTAGPTPPSLGESDYLWVKPGDIVRGKAQLLTPPVPGAWPSWAVVDRSALELGPASVEIWTLQEEGAGAALVFVTHDGRPPRVIGTYAISKDLYPRHMQVVATWRRRDCAMAVLLVREDEEAPADEQELAHGERPPRRNWLAIGVAPDRVWRTSDLIYAPVELLEYNGWPELQTTEGKKLRFQLLPETLRFVEMR